MTRSETIACERWRVQAFSCPLRSTPQREVMFIDETAARAFYDSLDWPAKRLQVRRAESSRFTTVERWITHDDVQKAR